MEEWKQINTYNNYAVSNTGKLKNIKTNRILKPFLHKKGYHYISIAPYGRQGKKITLKLHRLVAEAFIPNPENKIQINHIDGNKINNMVANLEWVTAKENMKHAIDNNLQIHLKGSECTQSTLTEEFIEEIRKKVIKHHKEYGIRPMSRKYGIPYSTLCEALLGTRSWKHTNATKQ